MLKKIKNLGKIVPKESLKKVNGGGPPFIGSGCGPRCPSTCASLGGICVPCSDFFGTGEECRLFG